MATRRKKGTARAVKRTKTVRKMVVFGRTTTNRIRFILPSGKWSMSYANRGAARRGARRIYKTRITTRPAV